MTNFEASAYQSPIHALSNPFSFSGRDVRTATDERGEAWFCAKDVFEAL